MGPVWGAWQCISEMVIVIHHLSVRTKLLQVTNHLSRPADCLEAWGNLQEGGRREVVGFQAGVGAGCRLVVRGLFMGLSFF